MSLLLKSNAARVDSVRDYLREIGRYPLLTADQEVEHARNVQAYRKCLEAKIKPTPEQKKLHDRSKQAMLQSNLRLVVNIAAVYAQGDSQLLQDLIQEGSIGLNRAVEKFDPARGYKFSTYAHWWVKQAITRYKKIRVRIIRLPVNLVEHESKVLRACRSLHLKNNAKPTIAQIAEESQIPIDKVERVLDHTRPVYSLDQTMKAVEDDGDPLLSIIADDAATPEEAIDNRILKERLTEVLGVLPDREQRILRQCFGLDCDRQTLSAIAVTEGVTRERIRQLRARALRALQKPKNRNKLRGLL